MLIPVTHPVPVRWRPPRARSDRYAFQRTVTTVEIPEVDEDALLANPFSRPAGDGPLYGFLHAGRLWRPLGKVDLDHGSPNVPAGPEDFARTLSSTDASRSHFVLPGTPLLANARFANFIDGRGSSLPDRVLAQAAEDLTEPARAALRPYMAARFVHARGTIYHARRHPVVLPHAGMNRLFLAPPAEFGDTGHGIAFEAGRLPWFAAYARRIGYHRDSCKAEIERLSKLVEGLGDAGEDLRTYANDSPLVTLHLAAYVSSAAWDADITRAALDAMTARLRPYADLGVIGAIPHADHPRAADAVGGALAEIRAGIPRNRHPKPLNWLGAYTSQVVRPYHATASPQPIPPDDAESLGALAM